MTKQRDHDHDHRELQDLNTMLAKQEQRREIGRLGAYAMHAKHDSKAVSGRSQATRLRHIRERLDPTGELARRDPQELAKRVESALNEEMARARLAKRQRAINRQEDASRQQKRDQRARLAACEILQTQILITPPDRIPQLATLLLALQAVREQPPR